MKKKRYYIARTWPLFMVPILFPVLIALASLFGEVSIYTYTMNAAASVSLLLSACLSEE